MDEKKRDIFKTDLIVVGVIAGALVGSFLLGKRSGLNKGYVIGTITAYETVFKSTF